MMRRTGRFLSLLLSFLFISVLSAFAAPVALDGRNSVEVVGPFTRYLADPSGSLSWADAENALITDRFQPVTLDHFDAGYSIAPHWISVPVRNDSLRRTSYLVSSNLPFVPALSIKLLRRDGAQDTLLEKDTLTPWRADQFLGQSVVSAQFLLDPGERAMLLMRFEPYGIGILPLSIETPRTAFETAASSKLTLYAFYSFAITSLVLLFLFVLALWHPGGLNFLALFGSGLVMMAQLDGILNQWMWPEWPDWNKIASFPMLLALCSAGLMTAGFMLRTGGMPRMAQTARMLALACFAPPLLSPFVEVAWLILIGFVFMVIAMGILTYAVINWAQLLPRKSRFALIIGTAIFLAVGAILVDVLTGRGNLAAQNLTLVKVLYVLITLIIMMSYATHVAALNREHAVSIRRELELARNEARMTAELLESERRYAHAQGLVARQRSRLADASHDLRQPIASLRLTLDAIARGQDGVVDETITRAFDYLDDLVSAHLVETREGSAGNNEETTDIETMAVSLVTETVVEMFAEEASAKGIRLRHFQSDALITVSPMPVMRIVSNLVSNAIKYTSAGGVLVGARRRGNRIMIDVFDTGPGMSPAEIQALTARYQKGVASTGEGLGLAICFELAAYHDFNLAVVSFVGRGTRFSLEVPAAV